MNITHIYNVLRAAMPLASSHTISRNGKEYTAMGGHMDTAAQETSAAMSN